MRASTYRLVVALLGVLGVVGVAGCAGAGHHSPPRAAASSTAPAAPAPVAPASPRDVGVSGTRMTLNGRPWMPRGITLQALVQPAAALRAHGRHTKLAALTNYGPRELAAIHAYGADTIRFQISQPALDPHSPLYDAGYLQQVAQAVELARRSGFVVLLCLQDERITGAPHPHKMPTSQTVRDWMVLNHVFGNDTGVAYEVFNEPHLKATPANWARWAHGSSGAAAGHTVGMQTLVTRLRHAGSRNVLVLDGLDMAHTLAGLPPIHDPQHKLVYAVHPYLDGSADETHWDTRFGQPARTYPVWADEWSAATGQKIGLGHLPTYQPAVDLLNYLRVHHIPLCAGAFDIPRFLVQDVPGWHYTTYDHFSPTSTTDDAGQLIHTLYTTDYTRPLTSADGL